KKKAGLSMPEIAAANEFGAPGVPARPFMATSFDENKEKLNRLIQVYYDQILGQKLTARRFMQRVGEALVDMIQLKINAIQFPPNSPRTIAIKKSSKPLIDFGQMIQSVTTK